MKKYYFKKENIKTGVSELIKSGVFQEDHVESIKAAVHNTKVRDGQYLTLETIPDGSGVKVYTMDSARVPLSIRNKAGEVVDSAIYI